MNQKIARIFTEQLPGGSKGALFENRLLSGTQGGISIRFVSSGEGGIRMNPLSLPNGVLREGPRVAFLYDLFPAERVGFEPTVARRATTVFETAPFVHSGTSPEFPRGTGQIIPENVRFTYSRTLNPVRFKGLRLVQHVQYLLTKPVQPPGQITHDLGQFAAASGIELGDHFHHVTR